MDAQRRPTIEETTVEKKSKSNWIWIIVLLGVIVLGGLWWKSGFDFTTSTTNTYQAVFLTNNQVYFGKLENKNSQFPVLTDVFYLQITQNLQPSGQQTQPGTDIKLIQLGGELHGPQNAMVLNRDQIIFYENLKSDSQVVTAILKFKEGK